MNEGIRNGLIENGYVEEGNKFIKEQISTQQFSINGEVSTKEIKHQQIITYMGEGCEINPDGSDGQLLYGFELSSRQGDREQSHSCIWVKDWNEFVEFCS